MDSLCRGRANPLWNYVQSYLTHSSNVKTARLKRDLGSRAVRLGPRPFSVGAVDSLDGGFVEKWCQLLSA